jgi:CHAD domain-containing protein
LLRALTTDTRHESDPDRPAGEAIAGALGESVRRLLAAVPEARAGAVEAVHRMRVATRRLRSDLRTFGPLIRDDWAGPLRAELKWLADVLGDLRDLDVLVGRLRDGLGPHDAAALAPLLDALDRRRDSARAGLVVALAGERYALLTARLVAAAAEPGLEPAAGEPSRDVLPRLVARAWRRLKRRGRALRRDDPAARYHQVRIRAKRARYAAEAVAPALGRKAAAAARRFAGAAGRVQDVLGAHQDATVAHAEITQAMAARPHDRRFLDAAARLARRQRRDARLARDGFRDAWRQLDRPKIRRWLRG